MKFLLEVLPTSVGDKTLATFCQVSLNLSLQCLGTLEEDNKFGFPPALPGPLLGLTM